MARFIMENPISLFFNVAKDIKKNREIIYDLVKNDFRNRYVGNVLGIFWAFLQPIALVLIFWFVFQVGFKSRPEENVPFILWLLPGLVPWFFFSESLISSTRSILDNSFLVKKLVFKVSLLPLVKIISSLIIHGIFIIFMLLIFILYGYYPTIYWFEVIYYIFCCFTLILSISMITSSVIVFFRDLGEIIAMFLQMFFWITPIIWSPNIIPTKYLDIVELNPMYYIIEGFRGTLIRKEVFWENPYTIYFWVITLTLMFLSNIIFKKLKVHFADVI
jgi:teichoic acid transport system permease protein